jgi:hypothetical protein
MTFSLNTPIAPRRPCLITAGLLAMVFFGLTCGGEAFAQQAQTQTASNSASRVQPMSDSDRAAIERDRERAMRAIKAKSPQSAARILEPWHQKYPAHLGLANDYAIALAQLGRLDDASKALESAFLENPESQEAFENLRQILSRQAAVFYAKAVGRPSPSGPLALKGDPLAVTIAPTIAAATTPSSAPDESPAKAEPSVKQAAQPALPKATSGRPAATSPSSSDVKDLRDVITGAAERWAQAWESKDFEGYLASYSENFQPQMFPSREAWAEHRRPRVTRPGPLLVRVSDIRVKPLAPDRVEVKLRQRYEASGTKLNSVKTLVFVNENGGWKILREDGR